MALRAKDRGVRNVPTMRLSLHALALVASFAALFVVGGGHWAALQTAAWARMVVTYTHDSGSLREGLARTFDGAHPCKFCRQISAGIEKEKRGERQQPEQDKRVGKASLVTVLPTEFSASFNRRGGLFSTPPDRLDGLLADAPPVPPPRAA